MCADALGFLSLPLEKAGGDATAPAIGALIVLSGSNRHACRRARHDR